jgi:hypothetical protein
MPVVLLYNEPKPQLSKDDGANVDAFFSLPIDPGQLILMIAQLTEVDSHLLLEKYSKIMTANLGAAPRSHVVRGGAAEKGSSVLVAGEDAGTQRTEGYNKFLNSHQDEAVDGVLARDQMVKRMNELEVAAEKDHAVLEKIDEEKKEFVKALFKK